MKKGGKTLKYMAASILATVFLLIAIAGCGDSSSSGNAAPVIGAEDALRQANDNIVNASSYRMNLEMNMRFDGNVSDVKSNMAEIMPFSLGLNGSIEIDQSNPEALKFRLYEVDIEGLNELLTDIGESKGDDSTESAMMAGMATQMTKDVELIFLEDTIYFKFGGNWFRMSPEDMPEDSGVDLGCLFSQQAEQSTSPLGKFESFIDITELDGEQLDGVNVRHFQARLNPESLQDEEAEEAAKKCVTDPPTTESDDRSEKEIEAAEDEFFEGLAEGTSMDFWIDDDLNIRRHKAVVEMDMSDFALLSGDYEAAENMGSVVMTVEMDMTFSAIGDPLEITAPEDAYPMKDLANPFGANAAGTAPNSRTRI